MTETEIKATRLTYGPALRNAIREAWETRHTMPAWCAMQLRLAHYYRAILRELP